MVVDDALLPLGRDGRTALPAAQQAAAEGEGVLAGAAAPADRDRLLHPLEERPRDQRLMLHGGGGIVALLADQGRVVERAHVQAMRPDRRDS